MPITILVSIECRDVNRKMEILFENWFYFFPTGLKIYFLSFSSRKLHRNYQMSGKINWHICLILSVYKSFQKRSNMAGKEAIHYKIQLGLKYKCLWRRVKPKTGFKPVLNNQKLVWNNRKLVCQKKPVLTSLDEWKFMIFLMAPISVNRNVTAY